MRPFTADYFVDLVGMRVMATDSSTSALRRVYHALVAFRKSFPSVSATAELLLIFFALFAVALIWEKSSEAYSEYKFNHLSPAEHLRLAQDACRAKLYGAICVDAAQAIPHLNKIPHDAAEYGEGHKLLEVIQLQEQAAAERQRQSLAAQEAERIRLANQTQQESFEQMQRNIAGIAHDGYRCTTSTVGEPILSFDNGHYWWADDGRCAAAEQKRQAAEQQRQEAIREREQRRRDEDAQPYSYWPTTVRVETDMDSFWLNNEERTCQTVPDDNGRVARVTCNSSPSHQTHNIPVKFWGGVDRNTVSDWKCRREGDEFVCRATD